MKRLLAAATALFFTATLGSALAQDANGNNPAMSPKARLARQHHRIEKGVKNGTVSPKEHRKLAREGRHINRQRRRDLKKDGGALTKKDRRKLEREENHRSNQIQQDKHN